MYELAGALSDSKGWKGLAVDGPGDLFIPKSVKYPVHTKLWARCGDIVTNETNEIPILNLVISG